jgi:hypothetical protein
MEACSAADMISITSGEYTTSQPEKFSIVAVTRQFPSGALPRTIQTALDAISRAPASKFPSAKYAL